MNTQYLSIADYEEFHHDSLFSGIAQDIQQQGYSIRPNALPPHLVDTLTNHLNTMNDEKFQNAGIGRGNQHKNNSFVRSDEICWITGNSEAGQQWLDWINSLQNFLNRHLFLGLFSFESHFSHYAPGDYYKRHYDAFHGETNRVLTIVAYFNSNWTASDKGELVLYQNDQDKDGIKVMPLMGTLVTFLSTEFPHEVLATNRDRYAIAGWFRVNELVNNKVILV